MTKPTASTQIGLVLALLSIASLLVGAGIYIGKLDARIDALEKTTTYYHGGIEPPPERK